MSLAETRVVDGMQWLAKHQEMASLSEYALHMIMTHYLVEKGHPYERVLLWMFKYGVWNLGEKMLEQRLGCKTRMELMLKLMERVHKIATMPPLGETQQHVALATMLQHGPLDHAQATGIYGGNPWFEIAGHLLHASPSLHAVQDAYEWCRLWAQQTKNYL